MRENMATSRLSKYIVTDVKRNLELSSHRTDPAESLSGPRSVPTPVMWLDSKIMPGAFYVESVWIWPECASERNVAKAHTHPFDEIVTFFGTNWDDPHDLCGEIELWLEDEKFVMTKNFLAFIPAGMKHCPLIVRRVDRPIFHFNVGTGTQYSDKTDL
jgi:hypothetical protein